MANRFRVSRALLQRLDDFGIAPALVLRHAGIPASVLNQEKIAVTTAELFAIYRAITDLNPDPAIALKLGAEERMERYDPASIAALCTRSFRDALHRLGRYKQLTCPEKIEVHESAQECTVRFNWLLAEETEPPMLIDLCFAWVLAIGRRGSARPLSPIRVEFRRPSINREMYEAHFGCRVVFDAPHNVMVFDNADLDAPFHTHNADLLAAVAPQLEAELKEHLAAKSTAEQVKGALKALSAGQRPSLQAVARELRLSTRTLQRRLAAEDVTFQQLIRESRRELARHYLLHSSLELNETAYLLGYEDANSFFRAFHEWEGTSPSQWRASHLDRCVDSCATAVAGA